MIPPSHANTFAKPMRHSENALGNTDEVSTQLHHLADGTYGNTAARNEALS